MAADGGLNPESRLLKRASDRLANNEDGVQPEVIDGIRLPPAVPRDRIVKMCDDLKTRPDDVFIVSYPKSGTTWTQQVVKLITTNGEENGVNVDVFAPWIETMTTEEVESMVSPRFFKTHLPYNLMRGGGDPEKTNAKYIYLMRNPKDVVVSFQKFMMHGFQKKLFRSELPLEVSLSLFCTTGILYGSFYDHILGWWAHRDAPNILILTYEQMKRDPYTSVNSIATFLGYSLTDDVIGKIVTETSFDKMKGNKTANKELTYNMTQDICFLRKGVIGDWKNVLTPEQSSMIDAVVAEKMKDSGIVFDYGDD